MAILTGQIFPMHKGVRDMNEQVSGTLHWWNDWHEDSIPVKADSFDAFKAKCWDELSRRGIPQDDAWVTDLVEKCP